MWTRVNLKKETAPIDSRQAKTYKKYSNEFLDAFMNGQYTLQELLNETMSEGLLVFIADHMHQSMRSKLHSAEMMYECVQLALGLSKDPNKPVSRETQNLALGLSLLLNTRSTVVQCCTTFQPGHSDRCTGFWEWLFDAMIDATTIHSTYYPPSIDPIERISASFSTLIRHVVINWNKGPCVLFHLSQQPLHVQFLLQHIENDDFRDTVVRLIYCDHSYATMQKIKGTKLISQLVQRLTTLPWSAEKENVESVLRSLIYAPYISPRGDLIYIKSIPRDKLTGEPDYVQLCGTSRDLSCTSMRQFTSRKIRHLVHMVMEQNHVPGIVDGMIEEFRHYRPDQRGRMDRSLPVSSPLVVSFGCTRHLTSLFELVTTVEFTEKTGKGHIGIECQYIHCQTHVMIQDTLGYHGEDSLVVLNCMLGLVIQSKPPVNIPLEGITGVKTINDHDFIVYCKNRDDVILHGKTRQDRERWVEHLENAMKGNVMELDIFCSDDWKSNIAEYQGLRLATIETMEKRIPELMNTIHTLGCTSWPLVQFCDMIQAIVGMQSKRMDALIVKSGLIDWILKCYSTIDTSWILTRLTQIIVYYLSDPNWKRSRSCLVVEYIMVHGPLEFLTSPQAFVSCIYQVVDQCIDCPHSNSTLRVAQLAMESDKWQNLLRSFESRKEPSHPSAIHPILQSATFSRPPAFQKDILDLLAQPSFASYDIGSSFLVGNGCVFGYVYKQEGHYWKRALVVYEQTSYKLWSFIPSQQKLSAAINWQWMVPTSVIPHFCQGEDELHTSIGHHGFDVVSDAYHNNTTWNFCTTALHERDEWLQVLQTAITTIAALAQHASAKQGPSGSCRECANCHAVFHVFRRPYPCLRCGKALCSKCSKNYLKPIPEMAMLSPVRHCQSCFVATGGAMSEQFPTFLQGGGPLIHEDSSKDLDRVGPELASINTTRQNGSRRHMIQIDIPQERVHSDRCIGGFPSTPLEVEDNPYFS